jgi:serine/threonine protein kinase
MGGACSSPELTDSDKLSKTYKRARLGQNLVQQTNKVDPLTRYEIVSKLGAGSMGSVSAVRKRGSDDHHYFAMKTLRPGRLTREFIAELKNEIRTVRRLDHPNIIKFHEVYYGKNISIIMDHCSGKDLYSRMPYTELQAAAIMKQVLEALAYMHKRSYVHLDIKVSENTCLVVPHHSAMERRRLISLLVALPDRERHVHQPGPRRAGENYRFWLCGSLFSRERTLTQAARYV